MRVVCLALCLLLSAFAFAEGPGMDPRLMQFLQQRADQNQRAEEMKNPKKPVIARGRAIRGRRNAPIQIVEYSDFQCPFCRRGFYTIEALRKEYGKRMMFMFKNLPLPMHQFALAAAKRFEAIALQSSKKAYAYHDYVFENQEQLESQGEAFLDEAAKHAGANLKRMKRDIDSPKVAARLASDQDEAQKFGFTGTPGFIVMGISVKGAYPQSTFDQIIQQRLSQLKQTGHHG